MKKLKLGHAEGGNHLPGWAFLCQAGDRQIGSEIKSDKQNNKSLVSCNNYKKLIICN